MGTKFSALGIAVLLSVLVLVLAIGWYAAGIGKKGGILEKGTQAVDESHVIKATLDSHADEANKLMNQLP